MKIFLTIILLGASAAWAQTAAKPLVIAHRGASGYLPEHTIAAKAYAHALGVDYIEQDLVLSKDDVPIVIHDIYVDTVTDVAKQFPGSEARRRPLLCARFHGGRAEAAARDRTLQREDGRARVSEAISRGPIVVSALNL